MLKFTDHVEKPVENVRITMKNWIMWLTEDITTIQM